MKIPNYQYNYQSQNISFTTHACNNGWTFDYNVSPLMISTKSFPKTFNIIKKMIPGVLETECFNDHNFSFSKEIKNTEIGHLFEHIVIYLLKEHGISKHHDCDNDEVIYEGRTWWNWKENPKGKFFIEVNGPLVASDIFTKIIKQANSIIEIILMSQSIEKTKSSLLLEAA